MGSKLLIVALLGLLGAAVAFLIYGWQLGAGAEISGFGYGAMALGIFATLLVGCGLMIVVFQSARRGYDEPAVKQDSGKEPESSGGSGRTASGD